MVDSVSVRFKNARVEKMPLNIRIQWNAGTACVSECVLKTLACRALRVGPSKFMTKFRGVSLLSSASSQGRAWEHAPGTLCKLLSSHSMSERRLECSEKAFRKRHCMSKFLLVFLCCFRGKKERAWEHKTLSVKSPALILSKNSGVSLSKLGKKLGK